MAPNVAGSRTRVSRSMVVMIHVLFLMLSVKKKMAENSI